MFFAPAPTRRLSATARPRLPILLSLAAGCLLALFAAPAARAQNPGDRDTSFSPTLDDATFYAFALETVNGVQTAFIAGDTGSAQRFLASNGGFDGTFTLADFGSPGQRIIYTAVLEKVTTPPDTAPKLLVGGLFGRNSEQVLDSVPAQNIARIEAADGTLDATFNPGSGANKFVTAILPLADGSMIVGGEFDQFNKIDHGRIVKLDKTGAIVDDSVFSAGLTFDTAVLSLAEQTPPPGGSGATGQILVAGTFSNVNGKSHAHLARLNADGTVDDAFSPVFSDQVRIVVSQPDGKILAGGDFESVNGQPVKHLVRLMYDGSLDTSFHALVTTMPAQIDAPVAVNTITPVGDGRYYIGGNFYAINGVPRHYLGRVLADGTVDGFDPGTTLSNAVQQVAVDQLTNKVFVTQNRDKTVNNVAPPSVFRLFGDPEGIALTVSEFPLSPTNTRVGRFKIARTSADTSLQVRVYVTRGGTAKNMSKATKPGDYTLSPALDRSTDIDGQKGFVVVIPAGKTSQVVNVQETGTARAGRTVTLTIQPDQSGANDYAVTGNPTQTVTLQ